MAARGTITAYFGNSSSEDRGRGGEEPTQKCSWKDTRDDTSVDTSRHVVGFNRSWETKFPWLVPDYTESEGKAFGMLCSLYKRHNTKDKYNRSTTWSETPCISLRKDSVRRHANFEQHQGAVALEKCRLTA